MKTFKIDKRFKLYKDNFRYCAEPTDNDYFSEWIDFCEKQWGSCATSNRWNHSYTKKYIGYNVILIFQPRIFFCNEKDLLWFTLGTSA
jgi:hypothetical protein